VRAGATGVGAGMGYMGPSTIHIGGGRRAYWGGAPWIRGALERGEAMRDPGVRTGGGPAIPENRREIARIVADEWRKAGMSEEGIAGVLANIQEESSFDPGMRHPDQPRFTGEAHFAHGLYSEGGEEWNNYARWLQQNYPGADWRDPRLQSRFAAENLKQRYARVWESMRTGSREQAAEAYVRGYLRPAARYQASRIAKFRRRGVPPTSAYTGGEAEPSFAQRARMSRMDLDRFEGRMVPEPSGIPQDVAELRAALEKPIRMHIEAPEAPSRFAPRFRRAMADAAQNRELHRERERAYVDMEE
jgi:hypothetical protein